MFYEKAAFCPCDIVLPKCASFEKWSVIACDQHTSDVSYWDEVENIVGGEASSYNMILPEAYLGTEKEKIHKSKIQCQMKSIAENGSVTYKECFVFAERKLSNGLVRRGIVGAVDLEQYAFDGSCGVVMPTEGTVASRVPPRVEVRRNACFELPHVMVFVDDGGRLIDAAASAAEGALPLYDFDLMLGGGHIRGTLIEGEDAVKLSSVICDIEKRVLSDGGTCYGVGDGNHSLAAAKSLWESRKAEGAPMNSVERYALVELVSISDPAIVFEPIYRLVKNVDRAHFSAELQKTLVPSGDGFSYANVEIVSGGIALALKIAVPNDALAVGVIQEFIDDYIARFGGECDYIHDEKTLVELSSNGDVGILFDGMKKEELFPYISACGALPRKTFSMGAADTKRYYLEMRRINL